MTWWFNQKNVIDGNIDHDDGDYDDEDDVDIMDDNFNCCDYYCGSFEYWIVKFFYQFVKWLWGCVHTIILHCTYSSLQISGWLNMNNLDSPWFLQEMLTVFLKSRKCLKC